MSFTLIGTYCADVVNFICSEIGVVEAKGSISPPYVVSSSLLLEEQDSSGFYLAEGCCKYIVEVCIKSILCVFRRFLPTLVCGTSKTVQLIPPG